MNPLVVYREDSYIVLDTSNGAALAFQIYRQTGTLDSDGNMEYERLPLGEVVIYKTLDAAKAAIAKGEM